MKHSSQFNPKSYEAKMLFRQIKQREEDLKILKFSIQDLRNQEMMLKKSLIMFVKKIMLMVLLLKSLRNLF